jgi:hypothetical protein
MERWTFLILAGDGGKPKGIRMILRAGDEAKWPKLQVKIDGTEVPVDDEPQDYEAPEWKAQQLFEAGGGTASRWEDLKEKLRAQA